MAGYFIVLGDIKDENQIVRTHAIDILHTLCHYGMYSTNLLVRNSITTWSKSKVATFTDYFGMKEKDFIFFFSERKIYGVGKLVNVGEDCKYWSFYGANKPHVYTNTQIAGTRLADSIKPENRCVCFFKPIEYYPHAIDMDEALTAFPDSFKALRTIQGRSFIKLGDEEAMALFSVLHRRNAAFVNDGTPDWTPPNFDDTWHSRARKMISRSPDTYRFTIESLLVNYQCWEGDGIREEMAIEAAVVNALYSGTTSSFDRMSYVTHQISASPAKPVEYMEWMDVFGYSVSDTLNDMNIPVQFAINRYYVMEIKRNKLSLRSRIKSRETKSVRENKAVANQLMKYVDWVVHNYARDNYPMVKGILIANDFDEKFIEYCQEVCIRNYNSGYRNAAPAVWNNFELIKYCFNGKNISFNKVYPRGEP